MAPDLHIDRRRFLQGGLVAGAALFSPAFLREALAGPAVPGAGPYGALQAPDANGLMLPPGFTGRKIAQGGSPVDGTAYPWHFAPDGQATYRTGDGGFVLVTNSEVPGVLGGGSSAIRFDAAGEITGAHRVLLGTNLNCGGGPTPWGTWLSGEEHEGGMIWEADPAGILAQQPRPALGNFSHEAAAVDPATSQVYLTEDQPDGLFYRFTPLTEGDLSAGVLEAAVVAPDGGVSWATVPDPNLVTQAKRTREQVPEATRFRGGEGLWHHEGVIYFTTKGDNKVWALHLAESRLETLYDRDATPGAMLKGVDNVTVSPFGDVYVCEDGDNMEICVISVEGEVAPFLRFTGADHEGSEMTGVIFDPSAQRMYFSSQRAFPFVGGTPAALGATYEVTGPFRLPAGGVPESWVFGPPAGEQLDVLPLGGPLRLAAKRTLRGARATLTLDAPATVDLVLRSSELRAEPWWSGGGDRPVAVTLATARESLGAGTHTVHLPVPPAAHGKALVLTARAQNAAVAAAL